MNENALLFEYAVVRYVPRIEREEFVNIGLLMMCKRKLWFRSAFELAEGRLRAFDPEVNVDLLRCQLRMFDCNSSALADLPVEERFRWFSAVKSAVIQTSRPHPGLISEVNAPSSNLDATFDRLFRDLVL